MKKSGGKLSDAGAFYSPIGIKVETKDLLNFDYNYFANDLKSQSHQPTQNNSIFAERKL